MALCDSSLGDFSKSLDQLDKVDESSEEGKYWIIKNLSFETKRLLKQKEDSAREFERFRKETLNSKVNTLKSTPTYDRYGDQFNKIVCTTADKLGVSLPKAELAVKKEIENSVTEQDIEKYIFTLISERKLKQLKNSVQKNIQRLGDQDKVLTLTSIQYEIDNIKTDKIWGSNKFDEIILNGLSGEEVNLMTMLCLINEFDYMGGYVANPNLNAYLNNPKLEPIPLIIDEILLVSEFLKYYGVNSKISMYIADTDYTEIKGFGEVINSNIKNIEEYINNIKIYVKNFQKVSVAPISQITDNNPLYLEVKNEIQRQIKNFKDPDFSREWYQKFEDAVERMFESQAKRKIFSKTDMREKTLEVTRSIWACNAAQGVVLGTLDQNTILISTERRERDANYTIDKRSRDNFPPVLYVLKAAENWNRKIVQKQT